MVVLIKEQEEWAMSYQWLEKQRDQGKKGGETWKMVDEAITAFDVLAWKAEMKYCCQNTNNFSPI